MPVIDDSAELFIILQEPLRLQKEHLLGMFIAKCRLEPLKKKAQDELRKIQEWKDTVEDAFYA